MSKLSIPQEFLVAELFKGAQPFLRICGASFDEERQSVVLEIEGPGVPDADEVVAVIHKESIRVEFQTRK